MGRYQTPLLYFKTSDRLIRRSFVNVELVVFYALLSNNNKMNSETTSFPESLFFPTSGRRETLETRLI